MKKIISLILTMAFLATFIPAMLASAESETVTVDITESVTLGADYYDGYGGKVFGETEKIYIGSAKDSARADYRKFLLVKAPLASVAEKLTTGKTVTKVELIMTRTTGGGHTTAKAGTFSFYNASTSWDPATTVLKDWDTSVSGNTALYPEINININEGVGSVDVDATADATTTMTVPAVSASSNATLTLDITGVYKAAFPSNNVDESSFISILGRWDVANTYHLMDIISSTYTADATLRPKLRFTIDDIPALTETSSTLPEVPSDDFALTVTNSIKTATVKINDEDVESSAYTISGDTLTLDNYQLAPFKKYKVDVVIEDYFNQKITKTYNFETSYDATCSEVFASEARYISATENKAPGTNGTSVYNATEYAVAYRVALPSVPEGGYLESFKFSCWAWPAGGCPDYSKYVKMYELSTDSALETLTLADISEILSDGNVINPTVSDKTHVWYSGASEADKPLYTLRRYTVDATAYANRCLAEGNTSIVILATCEYTLKLMGVSVDSTVDGICHPTGTSIVNESPSITVSGKDILPAGTSLKKADITFITRFPASVTDYLELRTSNDKTKVQGITFTYDEAAGTLGIAEPVTGLLENTEYELVLKAGAQDNFGNSVTEDMVLQKFTTTVDFAVNELKILEDSFAVGTDDFDSAATLDTAEENEQIKAVCEIVNNAQAKNVFVIIVSYKDSDKSEISDVAFTGVTAEPGEDVYASEAITIASDTKYVKAFVWDGATFAPLTQVVDFER